MPKLVPCHMWEASRKMKNSCYASRGQIGAEIGTLGPRAACSDFGLNNKNMCVCVCVCVLILTVCSCVGGGHIQKHKGQKGKRQEKGKAQDLVGTLGLRAQLRVLILD